jgi:hypothetical protein
MKKILTTLAGTLSLALMAGACSAVDTTETKSIAPVVAPATSVKTPPVLNKNFDRFDYFGKPSRSATRPVKPVVKAGPSLHELHLSHLKTLRNLKAMKVAAAKAAHHKKKVVKTKVHHKKTVHKKTAKKYKKVIHKVKKAVKVSMSGIASCIAKYESGGNPRAQNRHSTASGLFQFIDGTWNHFGGYARAMYAPVSVQLKKFYQVWNGGRGAGNWVVAHKCGY